MRNASNPNFLRQQTAADDATAHRRIDPRVDRGVGDGREPIYIIQRVEVLARAIPIEDQIKHDRSFRQHCQALLELAGRQS